MSIELIYSVDFLVCEDLHEIDTEGETAEYKKSECDKNNLDHSFDFYQDNEEEFTRSMSSYLGLRGTDFSQGALDPPEHLS